MFSVSYDDTAIIPNLPPEVFLDTSIPIARLKGEDLKRRVDEILSRFRWKGIGAYSKLEYGNVVLSAAGYLLEKLRKLGSLEKLRYFIHNRLPDKYWQHYKDATDRSRPWTPQSRKYW